MFWRPSVLGKCCQSSGVLHNDCLDGRGDWGVRVLPSEHEIVVEPEKSPDESQALLPSSSLSYEEATPAP